MQQARQLTDWPESQRFKVSWSFRRGCVVEIVITLYGSRRCVARQMRIEVERRRVMVGQESEGAFAQFREMTGTRAYPGRHGFTLGFGEVQPDE